MSARNSPIPNRLVADVGGTNTRAAIVRADGSLAHLSRLRNDKHAGLGEALSAYLESISDALSAPPQDAAIAVAAPITGAEVRLTNRRDWVFSTASLAATLRIP
ncbi:MAG: glucokinase, partial [Pseudomonadota bacterium]